jgi:N-acyl-D-amino-acid deacylase
MLTLTTLAALALAPAADPVQADVVLRGGTVHDGSGKPSVVADVAIKGDRIVAVGSFAVVGSPRVIDVGGMVVAPGFIDLHTHSDTSLTLPATRPNLNYLFQGVTLAVTGNCGSGPTDVAAHFKKLDEEPPGSNVIHQVPHNSVRQRVMQNANRVPTADELRKMEELVDRAMRDGCYGLSTGLIYNPGTYSKTDELIALAKVAARHGGFYASHIRDEGGGVLSAVEEALMIGREAKLPVHISHLKASGKKVWGKAGDIVALIQQARDKGQAVTADQYPYEASSTSLRATLVPAQFREGTEKEYVARLSDPEQGPRIRKALESAIDGRDGGKRLRVASYARNPAWNGKDLAAIAGQEKKTPLEIVLEIEKNGGASVVNFGMSEEDVRLIMKQPFVATASDGGGQTPGTTVPHPRSYGTFPRKIGRYAIEEKLITLEHAIRASSGLPADVLRLKDRGYLKPGQFADVVVFDPATFRDQATYDRPHQYATGVRYLFVNGTLTISEGRYTGARAGRVLRHRGTE